MSKNYKDYKPMERPLAPSPFDRVSEPWPGSGGRAIDEWRENEHGCFSDTGRFIPKEDKPSEYGTIFKYPVPTITQPGMIERAEKAAGDETEGTDVNGWFSGPGVKGKRK